jgi:hypothetical protein
MQRLVRYKDNKNFVLVLMSATGEVLTALDSVLQLKLVNWQSLKRSKDLVYSSDSYVPVEDLKYHVDEKCHNKNETLLSEDITNEYLAAYKAFGKEKLSTFAYDALSVLTDFEISGDEYIRGNMVILRLANNSLIRKIKSKFKNAPFDSLYHSEELTISSSLSDRARNTLTCRSIVPKEARILDLKNIPCLVLVNKKLGMGERIPKTCRIYDIRGKYSQGINIRSTFIQDVGRAAGHYRNDEKPPVVFINSEAYKCFNTQNFSRLDSHLTANIDTLRGHPEHMTRVLKLFQANLSEEETKFVDVFVRNFKENCGVYNSLQQHIVILAAEPQVGKTSSVLTLIGIVSLLNTLHEEPENYFITGREQAIETVVPDIVQKILELSDTDSAIVNISNFGNNHFADAFTSCLKDANRDADVSMGLAPIINVNILCLDWYENLNKPDQIESYEIQWNIARLHKPDISPIASKLNYIVYCLFAETDVDHHLENAYKSLTTPGTLYLCLLKYQLNYDASTYAKNISSFGFITTFSVLQHVVVFRCSKNARKRPDLQRQAIVLKLPSDE